MLYNYLSEWLIACSIIYFISYYFSFNIVTDHLNPYYCSVILLIGYIITEFYFVFIQKYTYEPSFFLYKLITHVLPFVLSHQLIKDKHKNSLKTFLLVFGLYMIYLLSIKKNMWDVYFVDKPPTTWKEYHF